MVRAMAAFFVVLVSGCSALNSIINPLPSDVAKAINSKSVPFMTILHDTNIFRGPSPASTYVANDETSYRAILQSHSFWLPDTKLPQVDFAAKTVIAVFADSQPTIANTLDIVSIEDTGESLVINSVLWKSRQGMVPTQSGAPAHFVTIDKQSKPIAFHQTLTAYQDQRN